MVDGKTIVRIRSWNGVLCIGDQLCYTCGTGNLTGFGTSVCSEPDHGNFHGNIYVPLQYAVSDPGSGYPQKTWIPAAPSDSDDVLLQLLY